VEQGCVEEAEAAMVEVGAEVEVEEGRIDGSGWVGDDVDAPFFS
jgi:hypothetical protein